MPGKNSINADRISTQLQSYSDDESPESNFMRLYLNNLLKSINEKTNRSRFSFSSPYTGLTLEDLASFDSLCSYLFRNRNCPKDFSWSALADTMNHIEQYGLDSSSSIAINDDSQNNERKKELMGSILSLTQSVKEDTFKIRAIDLLNHNSRLYQLNGQAYGGASFTRTFTKDQIIESVSQDGLRLQDSMSQDDPAVVNAAVMQNPAALQYASQQQVLRVVGEDGLMLRHAAPTFRNDQAVVDAAVRQNREALQYASQQQVLRVVGENGLMLQHVGNIFQDDQEVVDAAVEHNPAALQHASQQQVLRVVRVDGLMLRHAGTIFRDNQEVIDAAVRQNRVALQYSENQLRQAVRDLRTGDLNSQADIAPSVVAGVPVVTGRAVPSNHLSGLMMVGLFATGVVVGAGVALACQKYYESNVPPQ